jgi:anti-sigma factor RsiW
MGKRPDLSDDDWAELTAYLDGELDKKSARTMESKLNANPSMRAEAEALQKTWQMLDYLPQPEASATFTSKTLERLSIVLPAAGQPKAPPLRNPWAFGVGWAAAVLLAGSVGFTGVSLLAPPSAPKGSVADADTDALDQRLVQDLRIIENKRLYEQVDNIEFLMELDRQDLFGDDG